MMLAFCNHLWISCWVMIQQVFCKILLDVASVEDLYSVCASLVIDWNIHYMGFGLSIVVLNIYCCILFVDQGVVYHVDSSFGVEEEASFILDAKLWASRADCIKVVAVSAG
jgi:hypothetical protein